MYEEEMPCGNELYHYFFHLMHLAANMNFKRIQALGIHPGQFPMMMFLQCHEGDSLREIADQLHIKPPTVTVTVQRLEKAGFVWKQPDEKDQRINRIYLTESGRNIGKEVKLLMEETERTMTAGFSDKELVRIKEDLHRIMENLAKAAYERGGKYAKTDSIHEKVSGVSADDCCHAVSSSLL